MSGTVVTLSGGVGGAKLVLGLSHVLDGERLVVACNTADDFDHLGLRVCPDIDSILYALSGLSDQVRGWGRKDETWAFMAAMKQLGGPDWFNLGDRDLATHVLRTTLLAEGQTLGEISSELARRLGISARILPMSNDPVATIVHTSDADMKFQHYFVRDQCKPVVRGFSFDGVDQAAPNPLIISALQDAPKAILIAPSNPYVSVDPILSVPGMRAALKNANAPVVAVSPIVGGQAIKGPAAKMMKELGRDVSALGIARHYSGLIDGLIIDTADAHLASDIEATGVRVLVAPTIMTDLDTRIALARTALEFAGDITP